MENRNQPEYTEQSLRYHRNRGVGPQQFHKNNRLDYAKRHLNRFNGLFYPP